MIVGSIKENTALEKRVSITPESAKNIIGLGLKVCEILDLKGAKIAMMSRSIKEMERTLKKLQNPKKHIFIFRE